MAVVCTKFIQVHSLFIDAIPYVSLQIPNQQICNFKFAVGTPCFFTNHGNLRYPPKATPPRNKALLRETNG